MTYEVLWQDHAVNVAARFLKDDPEGLRQSFQAIDLLTENPRPAGSAAYGSRDLRRVHVGAYRAVYEIDDLAALVVIIHVGRVG